MNITQSENKLIQKLIKFVRDDEDTLNIFLLDADVELDELESLSESLEH